VGEAHAARSQAHTPTGDRQWVRLMRHVLKQHRQQAVGEAYAARSQAHTPNNTRAHEPIHMLTYPAIQGLAQQYISLCV